MWVLLAMVFMSAGMSSSEATIFSMKKLEAEIEKLG